MTFWLTCWEVLYAAYCLTFSLGFFILAVGYFSVVYVYYSPTAKRAGILARLPCPPPAYPFLGHIPLLWRKQKQSPQEVVIKVAQQVSRLYGELGIWRVDVGLESMVVLSRVRTVKQLIKHCSAGGGSDLQVLDSFKNFWGCGGATGLICSSDPLINMDEEQLLSVFNKHTDVLMRKMKKLPAGTFVDFFDVVLRTSMDICIDAILGVNLNSQLQIDCPPLESIQIIEEAAGQRLLGGLQYKLNPLFRFTRLGGKYRQAVACLQSFMEKTISDQISKRKKNSEQTNRKTISLLDKYLTDHSNGSSNRKEIQDKINCAMYASYDAVASAVGWTLYLLGLNAKQQYDVQAELDSIFGSTFAEGNSQNITHDQLNRMVYLEMCIKEALRLFPHVGISSCRTMQNMEIDGFKIPAHSAILVPVFLLSRDAEQSGSDWSRFDPERFRMSSVGDEAASQPYESVFVPSQIVISAAKLICARLLRQFTVRSGVPFDECRIQAGLKLRPVGALKMYFMSRK